MSNFESILEKETAQVLRNYSFLKGGLAETLVERMFFTLGYEVYPVGYEKILPRLAQFKRNNQLKPKAIQRFEYGPDFFVCLPEGDVAQTWEVEVKFRKTGRIRRSEIIDYENENIIFIVLSPSNIYCFQNREFEDLCNKSGTLIFSKSNLLCESAHFNFCFSQKRIVQGFEEYCSSFYKNLPLEKEFAERIEAKLKKLKPFALSDIFKKRGS